VAKPCLTAIASRTLINHQTLDVDNEQSTAVETVVAQEWLRCLWPVTPEGRGGFRARQPAPTSACHCFHNIIDWQSTRPSGRGLLVRSGHWFSPNYLDVRRPYFACGGSALEISRILCNFLRVNRLDASGTGLSYSALMRFGCRHSWLVYRLVTPDKSRGSSPVNPSATYPLDFVWI